MKLYKIADFIFGVHMDESLDIPENFKKFEISSSPEDIQTEYFIKIVDELPEPQGECITTRNDLQVFQNGNIESRRMNFVGIPEPYGVYEEKSERVIYSYFKRSFLSMLSADTMFVSLFAMEKRMFAHDAMVLHCSALQVNDGVILFSGPSGIGKSTHADLWVKHRGARVINGDRTLLQKLGDRWMSLGWPICGSSEICHNESFPVKAIVFLGQAPENGGMRCRYFDSVKQLISQLTINVWNPSVVEKIWSMAEDLAAQIPVFYYHCNMEKYAVDTLESLIHDVL